MSAQSFFGFVATSLIFLALQATFTVVASVVHFNFNWDLNI